jgi:hypothetical protein
VTLEARLDFPEQKWRRYSAGFIVHTMVGYRHSNAGYIAAELSKAGFAALTCDSVSTRATTGPALQGSWEHRPLGITDACAALWLVSGDARIDADRVASARTSACPMYAGGRG